jgi:hypothetical protein
MSIVPTVILNQTSFGAANGSGSGGNPPTIGGGGSYNGTDLDWYTTGYHANGYYGYSDGLQTVSYKLTNFVGTIGVQATLATNPTSDDWFDVPNTQIGDGETPVTTSTYSNFIGSFVWIRIAVTNFTAGTINKVLYN